MFDVFIDGDNISLERYFNSITQKVKSIVHSDSYKITLVCQSNILFKYFSNRNIDISIICCDTTNKNATDAKIIFQAGKSISQNRKVIIVSNDKIYLEIVDNETSFVINYDPVSIPKESRLKKKVIIRAIKQLQEKNKEDPSYDIYLSDLQNFFPSYQLLDLRRYIASLTEVNISSGETVYLTNKK
jgi:hypothetical protein